MQVRGGPPERSRVLRAPGGWGLPRSRGRGGSGGPRSRREHRALPTCPQPRGGGGFPGPRQRSHAAAPGARRPPHSRLSRLSRAAAGEQLH